MKKVNYGPKPQPKIDPMIKFMNKKITVRMLLAHFNALPNLLRYVSDKATNDLEARIALHNFIAQAKNERKVMDPCEAVYGFAANLLKLGEGADDYETEKEVLAKLVEDFCRVNELGSPDPNWTERLKMVIPETPSEE